MFVLVSLFEWTWNWYWFSPVWYFGFDGRTIFGEYSCAR